ncbi:Conserved_hypothetical protein [Hexamita inflata]|uniref:Transmembrane protein n=1 Tax=Hexamita inflata TaxID=28002 RepID=A0AA86P428_9EUKA|nr:Conserved hypothetical protein [Hexamita inflata]
MFNQIIITYCELTRLQKQQIYNCFDQQTNINIFADSQAIYVTINSIQSDCQIPHGILVSLQIDSLGAYEPQVYLSDFDYINTKQFMVLCDDPICSNLQQSTSGIVIFESKTQVTYAPAGSVQISRGRSSRCFLDNYSYVELNQGFIVATLFPSISCQSTLATYSAGTWNLNTPYSAKVYITYSDNSFSIYDQLSISVLNSTYNQYLTVDSLSVPVRVKLSNPNISEYFTQTVINNVITKDMILFQIELFFMTSQLSPTPIKKIAQITVNQYIFTGVPVALDNLSLLILDNGLVTLKHTGPQAAAASTKLAALGATWYYIIYTFTTVDVAKTRDFRVRFIAVGAGSVKYSNTLVQSTCSVRFPGQGCEELVKKLKYMDKSKLKCTLSYEYYTANNIMVSNYTKKFDNFYDSCFSDGVLQYDNVTTVLQISVNPNIHSQSCTLQNNDVLNVSILLGNNTQLTYKIYSYKPGVQTFQIQGFNLSLHPEIRLQFYRKSIFQDTVILNYYYQPKVNDLWVQEILTIIHILAINLGVTVVYCVQYIFVGPFFRKRAQNKAAQKMKKTIQNQEED